MRGRRSAEYLDREKTVQQSKTEKGNMEEKREVEKREAEIGEQSETETRNREK